MGGFTLVEMLVVMALLGMLTSMALPSMRRWHDAVQARAQVATLVQSVRAAMFAAGVQRRAMRLAVESFEPAAAAENEPQVGFRVDGEMLKLRLPPGWQALRVEPAVFLASGLCEPGAVALGSAAGAALVLRVSGPLCSVALEADVRS